MEQKFVEMTGSPKEHGFSTKEVFMDQLAQNGFEQSKITKKNNKVSILVCEDKDKISNKMKLALELGIEIMTYSELADAFELEGDM